MPVSIGSLFEGGSYTAAVKEAARQGIEGALSAQDYQAVVAASICCWDLDAAQCYASLSSCKELITLVDTLLQFNIKAAVGTFPSITSCIGSAQIQGAVLGKARSVLVSMTPKGMAPDFAGYAAEIGVSAHQLESAPVPSQQSTVSGWGSKKISMVGQVAANTVKSRMH